MRLHLHAYQNAWKCEQFKHYYSSKICQNFHSILLHLLAFHMDIHKNTYMYCLNHVTMIQFYWKNEFLCTIHILIIITLNKMSPARKCWKEKIVYTSIDNNNIIMTMTDFILRTNTLFFFNFILNRKTLGKNKIFSLFSPNKSYKFWIFMVQLHFTPLFYQTQFRNLYFNTRRDKILKLEDQVFLFGGLFFSYFISLLIHPSLFHCSIFVCIFGICYGWILLI